MCVCACDCVCIVLCCVHGCLFTRSLRSVDSLRLLGDVVCKGDELAELKSGYHTHSLKYPYDTVRAHTLTHTHTHTHTHTRTHISTTHEYTTQKGGTHRNEHRCMAHTQHRHTTHTSTQTHTADASKRGYLAKHFYADGADQLYYRDVRVCVSGVCVFVCLVSVCLCVL